MSPSTIGAGCTFPAPSAGNGCRAIPICQFKKLKVLCPGKLTMRRTIILIMTVFLLGLIAVVGASTWKFTLMRNSITTERDGNIALFRLGGQAQDEVQALGMAVENLFKAMSASDVDTAKKALDQHVTAFIDVITTIQDPRFIAPLSATVVLAEGTQGEPL